MNPNDANVLMLESVAVRRVCCVTRPRLRPRV